MHAPHRPSASPSTTNADTARRRHNACFAEHPAALSASDPELTQRAENWAFGEVPAEASPDTHTRPMLQLVGVIAGEALGDYRALLCAALQGRLWST